MMWFASKGYSRRGISLLICLFFMLSDFMAVSAANQPENQAVRVGVFYFEGYHMKDDDGRLMGYGIEFLSMVSKYSHLNFAYTGYEKSWNDMLAMLERGEIDMVTSARKTPEREEQFDFSLPMGRNSTILSIRADETRYRSGDYHSYDGMRIGLITGSSQNQKLAEFAQEKQFSYQAVEYDNMEQLESSLKDGEIDAILSSNLRKTENERTLDTLATENFYTIVRKGDSALLEEINYAIEQMDINEGDWSNKLFYQHYGPVYSTKLNFSEREAEYIRQVKAGEKTITVTASGDRKPYSYVEDGELRGIIPDYFAQVMEMAGLPYEIQAPKDREEYYDLAGNNSVDVVLDRKTSDLVREEEAYRGFNTDTYLTAGVVQVTRRDFTGKIKTVARVRTQGENPLEKGIAGDDVQILDYTTREEALQAVLDGKADAAYAYTYTAQVFVDQDVTNSLNYTMVNDVSYDFRMYVRDSADHELVTILNKCIRQMPGDTFNQLIATYTAQDSGEMTLEQYMKAHPERVIATGLGMLLILSVIVGLILWAGSNRKRLAEKEQANRALEEKLDIVDALSRDYVNVYAVNIREKTAKIIKLDGYVAPGLESKEKERDYPYQPSVNRYIEERVHPEDREALANDLSLEKVALQMDQNMEYAGTYHVLDNGKTHNYQFTYVRMKEKGEQDRFTVLLGFRNIDEVVRREQERKEELAVALAKAEHANNAKTTFLNNMSHDIRTPMNAIIGFTSLAATHIDSRELVQSYLNKIMTSSKHLLSLINDVLEMSRIESGKVTIREKKVSLPEIMQDLKTIVQSDIKARQLEFYIDTLDVVHESVICDKLRLNQVLLNILSNAIKYTKTGGMVSVRIIETNDAPPGRAAYQFKIKDTGIGMSPEFLEHVFEPFEREQTATVSGIQGTGLGLAITKHIIDMMKGTVTVESEVDKGTEFTVCFQFRLPKSQEKTETLTKLADLRALIADDDVNTCMSVSKMLSSIGMRPDWTTQGKEAVIRTKFAVEQNVPYSVYIIDWLMPDMNGIEVVRRIRKIIGDMATILILTAYDWSDIEDEAREAGVTAFCSKPIFLSELRSVLAAQSGEQEEAEEEVPEAEEIFTGKRILLAEDNELNQEIAKAILEEAGFVVEIANNGLEAVEAIKQAAADAYDLILMDIQMPQMDGYEAAQRIRAMEDEERAAIPILAMTANAFEEDKQKALEAGMNGHIAKPIDVPKLMETLRGIFREKV